MKLRKFREIKDIIIYVPLELSYEKHKIISSYGSAILHKSV